MKKLQNRKGFTLVELLIVMAIIGILVLIAVPRFARNTDSARIRTLQANARTVASAVSTYVADNNGVTPNDITALFGGGNANTQGNATAVVYLDRATFTSGANTVQPAGATYAYDEGTGIVTATVPVQTMQPAEAPPGVTIAGNTATISINVTN